MLRAGSVLSALMAVAISSTACQAPVTPPAPPFTGSNGQQEQASPDGNQANQDEDSGLQGPVWCETFDPANLEWFDLELGQPSPTETEAGTPVVVSRASLPSTTASRYNTITEVCPGFHLVTTFDGDTRLLSITDNRWATTATLTPAGQLDSGEPGVNGGGPIWGFRDSLTIGDDLFFSDAVIDADAGCVYVAVHRVALADVIAVGEAESTIVYRSTPCVSFLDDYRSRAPIKTHLGGALAYQPSTNELYVSIGDMHLGSSSIGQAEAIGIANVERDYQLLRDPDAAISAVVAITDPGGSGDSRVSAKGLRNSLGMTVDQDGQLWLTDHGPQGGDELNLITEGADFGWPLTSEGQPYDRSNYPGDSNQLLAPWLDIYQAEVPGTTPPVRSWSPAIAPTSVLEYLPSNMGISEWADHLLISSLRGEAVVAVSAAQPGSQLEDRLNLGERIRDMVLATDGRLVLITDSSGLIIVSG